MDTEGTSAEYVSERTSTVASPFEQAAGADPASSDPAEGATGGNSGLLLVINVKLDVKSNETANLLAERAAHSEFVGL